MRRRVSSDDVKTATFGGWDGCISVLAFLLADRHAAATALLVAGLGGALGGCFSMATGVYESEGQANTARLRSALVMGAATLAGGLLPAVGFATGNRTAGYTIGIALSLLLATGVVALKREGKVGAARTYLLLAVTVAVTAAVGLLAPA